MAERFGRFWLHEKVGQGAMAEIFRATIGPDPETYAFDFAVKRLPVGAERDQTTVDMFLTEADVGKLLNHPNLVRVYEAGLIEGQPFIAMEHLLGTDLGRLMTTLRRQRISFPADLAVYVAEQLLRGLDYVHRAKTTAGQPMEMVHQDVTPSNIFVTYDGEVKLGDFGVARVNFMEGTERPNELQGKIPYLPPEALLGEFVDARVDLWSLAATLYEMVTGVHPFDEVSEEELLFGKIPRIQQAHRVSPNIDVELSAILKRALHPRLRKRHKDALICYRELKGYRMAAGIQVDPPALGQFVRQVMGVTDNVAQKAQVPSNSTDFAQPDYQVPYERTMTQRIMIVKRERSIRIYLALAAAASIGVLAALGVRQFWPAKAKRPAPTPPPAQVSAPSPAPPPPPPVQRSESTNGLFDNHFVFSELQDLDLAAMPAAKRNPFRKTMQQGRAASERREYDEAVEFFREAIKLNPKSTAAKLGLANGLFFVEAYREAASLVKTVLTREPRNLRALLLRADLMRAMAKNDAAKDAYEHVAKIKPNSRQAELARRVLAEW